MTKTCALIAALPDGEAGDTGVETELAALAEDRDAVFSTLIRGIRSRTRYAAVLVAIKVAAWLAATPETFRFSVKAQRGAIRRSICERITGFEKLGQAIDEIYAASTDKAPA